jgi:hypothetical protein
MKIEKTKELLLKHGKISSYSASALSVIITAIKQHNKESGIKILLSKIKGFSGLDIENFIAEYEYPKNEFGGTAHKKGSCEVGEKIIDENRDLRYNSWLYGANTESKTKPKTEKIKGKVLNFNENAVTVECYIDENEVQVREFPYHLFLRIELKKGILVNIIIETKAGQVMVKVEPEPESKPEKEQKYCICLKSLKCIFNKKEFKKGHVYPWFSNPNWSYADNGKGARANIDKHPFQKLMFFNPETDNYVYLKGVLKGHCVPNIPKNEIPKSDYIKIKKVHIS